MKLLQMCICDKQRYSLIPSINIKGLNIRYRKTLLMSTQIDIIFNIRFTLIKLKLI